MATLGTGQPLASRAVTLNDAGSELLKYQGAGSPAVFTSCVGAPGVQGPMPPPPQASTSKPAPSAGSPPQRKKVIAPPSTRDGVRTTIDVDRTRGVGRGSRHGGRPRPTPRRLALLEPEELPANLPARVQLGVHVDVARPATDESQNGIRNRRRVLDQESTEVRISGDTGWHVKIHPHRAVEARHVVVNVGQERTVDVRKLDPVAEYVTVDGNRREPLRRGRDRGRLVGATHERDVPLRR